MTMITTPIPWLIAAAFTLLIITFIVILPAYTLLLACATVLRSKWRTSRGDCGGLPPWSGVSTSFFRGTVFHVRHLPAIHTFKYPLYFAVVDLDEASGLFGEEGVRPDQERRRSSEARGSLWPLSSLMMLRDVDHLKNGEGLRDATDPNESRSASMSERISNLVCERTGGKLDLRSTTNVTDGTNNNGVSKRRRILLVTHLMYYGYCFNPVSLYFILKPNANKGGEEDKEEIEAVVVEVSNTPWNEMYIYVLHPDSVDTVEHDVGPSRDNSLSDSAKLKVHRYKHRKDFHVSPFMTMDHDYEWRFQLERDRIRAEARLIRRNGPAGDGGGSDVSSNGSAEEGGGELYFTGRFDIRRTSRPTSTYPLQLARVISRFPVYCFIIQLWIHYEALRLLMKGVKFIPHPEGSETGASRAIAAVMRPVFAAMDVAEAWWGSWESRGKSKDA